MIKKFIIQIINFFYDTFRKIVTIISPTLNTRFNYYKIKGKPINLKQPKELEEKLSWLKLYHYSENELVIKCADKLRVREYVKDKGYGHLLNELYYVFDSIDEIEPERLPNQFALKWNTGAGGNFICSDKNHTDLTQELVKMDKWLKNWKIRKPYLIHSEMHYSHIKPKLICEKYLSSTSNKMPTDYKIYCFNGEPRAILVMEGREENIKGVFMTPQWEFISYIKKYSKTDKLPKRPKSLKTMIEAAAKLSEPFPFVRVDFFEHENKAVFGELTFTPAGSLSLATTEIDGVAMGDLLDISTEMD